MTRQDCPRLYRIFCAMKQRCYNENHANYSTYGGQGIGLAPDWLHSFETFASWALANGYADELTIDRIDSAKDYCPENCRWVTKQENSGHTRRWEEGWKKEVDCTFSGNQYAFPAVFALEEDSSYSVRFPDIAGCFTGGDTLAQALLMAQDALCLMLYDLEESGKPIPAPSDPLSLVHESGELVSLVSCDTLEYRKLYSNSAVKKTLTVPAWLNTLAERQGVNFSQTLQNALKEQLHL